MSSKKLDFQTFLSHNHLLICDQHYLLRNLSQPYNQAFHSFYFYYYKLILNFLLHRVPCTMYNASIFLSYLIRITYLILYAQCLYHAASTGYRAPCTVQCLPCMPGAASTVYHAPCTRSVYRGPCTMYRACTVQCLPCIVHRAPYTVQGSVNHD